MTGKKQCPLCGAFIQNHISQCPSCGLEGVNQRFLAKADYDAWIREVLLPRKASLIKVFAGHNFGLILTANGRLYGIGSNSSGQIDENGEDSYTQPHLMATDVISAAAGRHYSIYATRNGTVHLRGKGELAERFTGFHEAKEVYACDNRFGILDNKGQIWAFGENFGKIQPQTRELRAVPPEEEAVTSYNGYYTYDDSITNFVHTNSINHWVTNSFTTGSTWSAEQQFMRTSQYRNLASKYGADNVYIHVQSKQLDCTQAAKGYEYAYRVLYSAKLYVTNNYLYSPVLMNNDWIPHTPHRIGSMPAREKDLRSKYFSSPVKKVAVPPDHDAALILHQDNRLSFFFEHLKDWEESECFPASAADIGLGNSFLILACWNGDILWYYDRSIWFQYLPEDRLNRCRLPEGDNNDLT